MNNRTCKAHECAGEYYALDLCRKHYRAKKYEGRVWLSQEDEFWTRVEKTDTCWNWTSALNNLGYGSFKYRGVRVAAHRYSYEISTGRELGALFIDHVCHNTICVNPAHLRAVTHKQNMENRKAAKANSATGVRGVFRRGENYQVRITHNNVRHNLGTFKTIEEATMVSIEARAKYFTHATS